MLVLLTPWEGKAVTLSASPPLLCACPSQILREAFLHPKSFWSYNIFILSLQVSPQPGFLGREKQEERREGLLPSLHLGVEFGSPSHYASLFSEGNHSKALQKRLCCRAVCGLVLGTSDRCLPTMLRGCQICWAFRSMPRTEQLLQ